MRCEDCKFFDGSKQPNGDLSGCHKRAPVRAEVWDTDNLRDAILMHVAAWPLVNPDDWCGDYEAIQLDNTPDLSEATGL